jgi:hypothetical protein
MTEHQVMKVKLVKLLQDIRDWNYQPNRRMPPKPTVLYLMQLRSHVAETTSPRRKLVIQVDLKGQELHPRPVQIKQLKPSDLPPLPPVTPFPSG